MSELCLNHGVEMKTEANFDEIALAVSEKSVSGKADNAINQHSQNIFQDKALYVKTAVNSVKNNTFGASIF